MGNASVSAAFCLSIKPAVNRLFNRPFCTQFLESLSESPDLFDPQLLFRSPGSLLTLSGTMALAVPILTLGIKSSGSASADSLDRLLLNSALLNQPTDVFSRDCGSNFFGGFGIKPYSVKPAIKNFGS